MDARTEPQRRSPELSEAHRVTQSATCFPSFFGFKTAPTQSTIVQFNRLLALFVHDPEGREGFIREFERQISPPAGFLGLSGDGVGEQQ